MHPFTLCGDQKMGRDWARLLDGPFFVSAPRWLAADVTLKSHVVITGDTQVGGTIDLLFAVIGEIPQDLKFKGEKAQLVIGARNRIREHVTMNLGTEGGGGVTPWGMMVCSWLAVISPMTAGGRPRDHCELGCCRRTLRDRGRRDHRGLSGLHQWVRVGRARLLAPCLW